MSSQITFSSDQIAGWQSRKAELENKATEIQRELAGINKLLEAVALLAAPDTRKVERRFLTGIENNNGHAEEAGRPPLMEAIPSILGKTGSPMTKAALKERLEQAGFADSQLGNYFYTALMRLKKRNMIRVLDDGRVSEIG